MKTALLIAGALIAMPAAAHSDPGASGAFAAGLLHPLTGLDHLLAMLGIGLWSRQPPQSVWLPIVMILAMAMGAIAFGGSPLPASGELALAAGVALLGVVVAGGGKASKWIAASLVALLGLLHGQAHAGKLPSAVSAIGYLIASAALLIAGRSPLLAPLHRKAGITISAIGVGLVAALA